MNGTWVEIKPPPCRCPGKPVADVEVHGEGSIWMCKCGKQWGLSWSVHGTQTWYLVETHPNEEML